MIDVWPCFHFSKLVAEIIHRLNIPYPKIQNPEPFVYNSCQKVSDFEFWIRNAGQVKLCKYSKIRKTQKSETYLVLSILDKGYSAYIIVCGAFHFINTCIYKEIKFPGPHKSRYLEQHFTDEMYV